MLAYEDDLSIAVPLSKIVNLLPIPNCQSAPPLDGGFILPLKDAEAPSLA